MKQVRWKTVSNCGDKSLSAKKKCKEYRIFRPYCPSYVPTRKQRPFAVWYFAQDYKGTHFLYLFQVVVVFLCRSVSTSPICASTAQNPLINLQGEMIWVPKQRNKTKLHESLLQEICHTIARLCQCAKSAIVNHFARSKLITTEISPLTFWTSTSTSIHDTPEHRRMTANLRNSSANHPLISTRKKDDKVQRLMWTDASILSTCP